MPRLVQSRPCRCIPYRYYSSDASTRRVSAVDEAHGMPDIQYFRSHAFDAGKPLLIKQPHDSALPVPAINKWFGLRGEVRGHSRSTELTSHRTDLTAARHLEAFSLVHVPYELMYPQSLEESKGSEAVDRFIRSLETKNNTVTPTVEGALSSILRQQLPPMSQDTGHHEHPGQQLLRFAAPLALLVAALKYNSETKQGDRLRQLYIAQASLDDLPSEMLDVLPTPSIVKEAGKGDIYGSSLWLGLEPTYTPLHRDPNPNLFIQLCSTKVVRLLPPSQGESIFRQVQMRLGRHGGSSRIRGAEMMEGPERKLLYETIWGDPDTSGNEVAIQEANLQPGDALFIPMGWWHSVMSGHDDGRLNGSVNWWFR